jgi:hypothetical protein
VSLFNGPQVIVDRLLSQVRCASSKKTSSTETDHGQPGVGNRLFDPIEVKPFNRLSPNGNAANAMGRILNQATLE